MAKMTSRERLLTALRHEEPDRVPLDLASTQVTGISRVAYDNLRDYLGMPVHEPEIFDVIQQICIPGEDLLKRLKVDTRGIVPLTNANWKIDPVREGEYRVFLDEWQCKYRMPVDGGLYYTLCASPIDGTMLSEDDLEAIDWPDATDTRRWAGLREQAEAIRAAGYAVVMKGLCAGILEMACRIRPMDKFMMDLALAEKAATALLERITDLKAAFWNCALAELGDVVDVVAEADDYGTQESMLISPEMYRRLLKPLQERLFAVIRTRLTDGFIFFHSCGNVRELIPDFIEIGADILNPVHIAAKGMEPSALKRDFGEDIVFWGGGVETQHVLPQGTPEQVRENVKANVEALAPGGGFVFNTVHNIQCDVPPENIVAMWEALQEFGAY